MQSVLIIAMGALALVSILASPRVRTVEGFFRGIGQDGSAPGLWTLVLSQVTTWIFARSLLNAAILGYLYGIAGTLAYAAYYGSFLTGAWIVDAIRFRYGHDSIQSYMRAAFGRFGQVSYDIVVALRLVSEVFANLLVIGIIFGAAGTFGYTAAILAVSAVTLLYAMMGGLSASLRTDVVQMGLLLALLCVLLAVLFAEDGVSAAAMLASSPELSSPGWTLLAVALLQIWSYPMHDPVMMDRGFLADRRTTRASFYHAFWLSFLCMLAFGLIGVHAGLHRVGEEALMETLSRLFSGPTMVLVNLALVVSAVSTLDSALSSASKLAVLDMRLAPATVRNGRIAMAAFMTGGLALLFFGTKDLFAAVAISGTASMFLAPVVIFCIWGGVAVPRWSYASAFVLAMAGALVYFLDSAGHVPLFERAFGPMHDYTKLLVVSLVVLAGGCGAFALGAVLERPAAKGLRRSRRHA
jgi:Na+/proline symporter